MKGIVQQNNLSFLLYTISPFSNLGTATSSGSCLDWSIGIMGTNRRGRAFPWKKIKLWCDLIEVMEIMKIINGVIHQNLFH